MTSLAAARRSWVLRDMLSSAHLLDNTIVLSAVK